MVVDFIETKTGKARSVYAEQVKLLCEQCSIKAAALKAAKKGCTECGPYPQTA